MSSPSYIVTNDPQASTQTPGRQVKRYVQAGAEAVIGIIHYETLVPAPRPTPERPGTRSIQARPESLTNNHNETLVPAPRLTPGRQVKRYVQAGAEASLAYNHNETLVQDPALKRQVTTSITAAETPLHPWQA